MPLIDKQRLMGSGQVTSASVENEGTFHPKQISGLNQWYDASDASTLTTASFVVGTSGSATSPTDVSGLRLWLDASDTSTIISESLPSPASNNLTSSFADVVCWLDATDSGSLTTDSWLPTSIASCSLWLDADDASSMTVSGTNISEWRNKSTDDAGLFDGVQSNASYQPTTVASEINGRSVVRFDGSDDYLNFSGSTSRRAPSSTGGEITSFIVMKKNGTPTAREVMMIYGLQSDFEEPPYAGTTGRVFLWYDRKMASPLNASMVVYVNAGWGITYDANSSTASMFSFARDSSSHQIYHTGSQVTAVTAGETTLNAGKFYPASNDDIYGQYGNSTENAFPFHGDIAELICYSRKLSTAERSTVETYLQNKWNITVATQSTDYYENKVSQWKDKSGNNNHFGQTTSANQPVLSASSFNGQQSVYNDGDDFLTASNFITSSANTTWFAVGQTTAQSTLDWIIACDGWSYALGFSSYINIYGAGNAGWTTYNNTPYYACWQHHNDKTFDASINGGHGLQVPYRNHTSINTVISVGGAYNNSGFRHTGDMVEFIFFTRSLNDNERISIERYLSNKYNITPWVSSSTRHKQWTDKSGQGNHAINKGWTYTPQYTSSAGSQSFGFYPDGDSAYPNTEFGNAGTNFYIGTTGSVVSDETFTVFAAITPRSVNGYNFMYSSNDAQWEPAIGWNSDNLVIYRGNAKQGANTLTNGVREIAVWGPNSSGSTYQIHSDGVLGGSDSYSYSNDFTDDNWILGSGRRNGQLAAAGNVHEFLVYTGSVSDADRTKIETYLQDKWGVTVATQSYGTSTVTSSVLTQWQDKSGNALHLTASSTASAPVLSANEIYSYSAVQFSGTVSSSNPVLTSSTNYGTPWYPTSIPSCSLWLDADDASTVVLNGADVLQWQDKSGNGNHFGQAVASRQPLYATAGNEFAPRSGVRMTGSAKGWLTASTTTDFGTTEDGADQFTIFTVVNQYGVGNNAFQQVYGFGRSSDGSAGSYYILIGTTGGDLSLQQGNGPNFAFSWDPNAGDNIIVQRSNAAGSTLRVTGTVEGTSATKNTNFAGTGHHVIGYSYLNRTTSHEYGEMIVYNRSLTDAEMATVETYLQNKWNITVATQSSDVRSDNTDPAYPTQSVSTEAKSIVSIIKQDNANSGSVWAFVSGSEYDGTLTTNEGGNTDFAYGGITETSSFISPFSNSTSSVVTAIWGGEYSKLYKDGTLLTSSQNNTTLSSSAYLALGTLGEPNTTPWYPTNIPSCSLWLDADDASSMTVSGTSISEWRNKSTEFAGLWNFTQDTGSNQPALSASAINGKNAVHFPIDDFFRASGSNAIPMPLGTDGSVTVFYVFEKLTDQQMTHASLGLDSDYLATNYNTYLRIIKDWDQHSYQSPALAGMSFGNVISGNGLVRSSYPIPKDTPNIFTIQNLEGGSYTAGSQSYDGGWIHDEIFSWNPDASYKYMLWGRYAENSSGNLHANVAEIIFYARHLSAAERTTVETYLQNKWNITVATQSSDIDTDNTLAGSTPTYWSGSIGEMLVYNKAISDKERTRAENYLKQKWRVTGSN